MRETNVTTTIIMAVKLSIKKPTENLISPEASQVYKSALCLKPDKVALNTMADNTSAPPTPNIVSQCAALRGKLLPNNPTIAAVINGSKGIQIRSCSVIIFF